MAKHKGSSTAYAAGQSADEKPKKKVLARIEIAPAENGGHIVTHHFGHDGMMGHYHQPEQHAFGKGDGRKMIKHVAQHMGVETATKAADKTEAGEEEEPQEQEDAQEDYTGGDDEA